MITAREAIQRVRFLCEELHSEERSGKESLVRACLLVVAGSYLAGSIEQLLTEHLAPFVASEITRLRQALPKSEE